MAVRKAVTEPSAGDLVIEFIEEFCKVPEGRLVGKNVKLSVEQKDWIRLIYDSPTRRFILSMGRKGGKTAFSAFLLLVHLVGPEARENSQLFSAAQSRDQAAILFALAAKIVRLSPELNAMVQVKDSAKELICPRFGTKYKALSAEASTAYGLSPALVVHDELGQVRGPRSELYEALETAAGAQQSPLSIIISTQSPTDADLLSVLIDEAKTKTDKRTKLVLYTADEALDPFGDEAIRQANPHFDTLMNKEEVRDQAERARRMPSSENSYRNLVLNQRVTTKSPLFSQIAWEACAGSVQGFDKRPVFIGLDLSFINDLTAAIAVCKAEDGGFDVSCDFWAPEKGCADRAHKDRVPYDVWAREGFLTLTPGASVDYAWVARRLCDMCDQWNVSAIAFDRWKIKFLEHELERIGRTLPLVEWGQGFKDMSPAVEALETSVLNGKLRHGGNPVLRMCAANAIVKMDEAGNRKLDKSKATGRIDGIVAAAMAMGCAASTPQEEAEREYQMFII